MPLASGSSSRRHPATVSSWRSSAARTVDDVDGQLAARPHGPGGLVLALNRGSEVFSVDREGPQLAFRRIATADEEAALSHAARLTVERLAARGLRARIVSERLNRRKIDLIPEPEWENPPKARIRRARSAGSGHRQ